ncbi:MAG: hypothetical protein AAB573_04445 [Patescibacteria group bacterium]
MASPEALARSTEVRRFLPLRRNEVFALAQVDSSDRRRRSDPGVFKRNERSNEVQRDQHLDSLAREVESADVALRTVDQKLGLATNGFRVAWPTALASTGQILIQYLGWSPYWFTLISSVTYEWVAALVVALPPPLLIICAVLAVVGTGYFYLKKRRLTAEKNRLQKDQDGRYRRLDNVTSKT